ncbi:MAG TPA: hypothetical protein VII63_12575 [Caulobacteraceae bacterium]
MGQLDLFPEVHAASSTTPTVESVRARIEPVLDALRSSHAMPWSAKEAAMWRVVLPQMANWLPAEERDAVRAEFAALIRRF